jgi:N6-L-threonylcarbamoyladenine synthase
VSYDRGGDYAGIKGEWKAMLVLGIESSCDETAAAILQDGRRILSNVIASQIAVHRKYGGVVPELASRHHLDNIVTIVDAAFQEAAVAPQEIGGIAVTQGPGLVGSLLVGLNYAKALSYSWKIPLVAIHHIEGHIYSVLLELYRQEEEANRSHVDWETLLPAIALVASGGHTNLFLVHSLGAHSGGPPAYQLLGRTRDDAAGEAFDKVAKLLGLGYPGGPLIDRLAKRGNSRAIDFPLSRFNEGQFDFSFSGLKTSVLRYVEKNMLEEVKQLQAQRHEPSFEENLPGPVLDLLASFQQAVVKMLFSKTLKAVQWYPPKSVFLAGGVACNSQLRSQFLEGFAQRGVPVFFPSPILSTDNAAMIAAAGYPALLNGGRAGFSLNADVHLKLA